MPTFVRFLKDESGPTMLEYVVGTIAIVIGVFVVFNLLGKSVADVFRSVIDLFAQRPSH